MYTEKLNKIKRIVNEIVAGRMPKQIGHVNTVERCAMQLQMLATLAYINNECNCCINEIVDVADELLAASEGKKTLKTYPVPYEKTTQDLMRDFYARLNEVELKAA